MLLNSIFSSNRKRVEASFYLRSYITSDLDFSKSNLNYHNSDEVLLCSKPQTDESACSKMIFRHIDVVNFSSV